CVVRFPADCITYAQATIAERMNHLLSLGAKLFLRSMAPTPDAVSSGHWKIPVTVILRQFM
ncbi:MAG: hypothetical protein ACPHI1_02295, partial [Candidatus Puniceispirillaceae bacterium]